MKTYFGRSKHWKKVKVEKPKEGPVPERCEFASADAGLALTAFAYRGSEMKQCLLDFEAAVRAGAADFIAYIGHNALMDFQLPLERAQPSKRAAVAVLCCRSQEYFEDRLRQQGGVPVLLTSQLMYPGSFLLHDALASWGRAEGPTGIRSAAAKAYAKNQGISYKAAAGIFAILK